MFDTTGQGYFEIRKGFEPDVAEFNTILRKGKMGKVRVTTLEEVDVAKAVACWEIAVKGLG